MDSHNDLSCFKDRGLAFICGAAWDHGANASLSCFPEPRHHKRTGKGFGPRVGKYYTARSAVGCMASGRRQSSRPVPLNNDLGCFRQTNSHNGQAARRTCKVPYAMVHGELAVHWTFLLGRCFAILNLLSIERMWGGAGKEKRRRREEEKRIRGEWGETKYASLFGSTTVTAWRKRHGAAAAEKPSKILHTAAWHLRSF